MSTIEPQPKDSSDQAATRDERVARAAAAVGAMTVLALGLGAYQQANDMKYQINPVVRVGVIDDIQSGNVDPATVTEWTDALHVAPKQDPSDLPPVVQHYKQ